MSILDSISKLVGEASGSSQGGNSQLIQQVMAMLGNSNRDSEGQSNLGGLSGLVSMFQNKGLGDLVSSWISTGENKPVSTDQMNHVMGDQISKIAASLGLSSNDVASQLSNLLPQIVDKLTPDGDVPDEQGLNKGLSALKGLFAN